MHTRAKSPASLLLMLAALILTLAPLRVSASVIPLDLEELVAISDELHTVKVESTECFVYQGTIYTRAKLDVMDSFKGTMTGTSEVVYPGGKIGPLQALSNTGMENAKAGDYAVLFLSFPLGHITDAEKARFNMDAPAIKSPQVVGGYQGRFDLKVYPNMVPADSPAPRESLLATAQVSRKVIGAARRADGSLQSVSYNDFANTIRQLVAEEKALKSRSAGTEITGVRGTFYVPARDKARSTARLFDPLPKLAYVSAEELAEIKSKSAEAAKRAALENAKKTARPKSQTTAPEAQATEKEGGK